ncbi:MAG: DnaJ domain-containing protein [Chlorogloeopsis fritschii C42_A2020_084]|uniref:DnaJ domain-containing protein n=1 Tax=Chlorogloeopsis fritschii TaxID=1124 RepID=UPI0019D86729|nr:DnaJ domain-containing protein [Chlorogloeopsis fritschii]MBF2005547.1 DnaJ domain-containing protein [Chlorogloeopsis fritschii C42_A2020_084]
MKNYYLILEIDRDASQEEIKSAYIELVKIYHPDRMGDISEGRKRKMEDKLKEVNEAYEALSDPLRRAEYEHWLDYNLQELETSSSAQTGTKDYYEILGVDPSASFDEIEDVYYQLIEFYDVDSASNCSKQERQIYQAKLREIEEAYQVLSDLENRSMHDRKLNSRGHKKSESSQPKSQTKENKPSKIPKINLW